MIREGQTRIMQDIKRLGIYVIYDRDNVVDPYIREVLKGLRKYLSQLIIVCNFSSVAKGEEILYAFTEDVYYRENNGFDAGAYKDIIANLVDMDQLKVFDELLLMNDSFYGPIDSFDEMFSRMKEKKCDFWGITRYPGGTYQGIEILEHVQSYFMCFRKPLIDSKFWHDFWHDLHYPTDFIDAVFSFELSLNRQLSEHGYRGLAYTDIHENELSIKYGENPYMKYPAVLIKDFSVPIIKRKSFDFANKGFENALQAIQYIDKCKNYDVELIKRHLVRVSKRNSNSPVFDLEELSDFYFSHKKIYIYGAGGWGKNLISYFDYKGWTCCGVIVSNKEATSRDSVIEWREAEIQSDDGIIIAVGKKKAIEEINCSIRELCSEGQIFKPHYLS